MIEKTMKVNTTRSSSSSGSSQFEKSLSVSKAARTVLSYLKGNDQHMITGAQIKKISQNESGRHPAELVDAAKFLTRNPDVFKLIETHDVVKPDDLSGYLNFEWASHGALDSSPAASIARMQDTFDLAIAKSSKITEMSTSKKVEIDSSKQRPSN